jgi:hypothetical protein
MLALRGCAVLIVVLLAGTVQSHAALIVAIDLGSDGQAVEPGYTEFSNDGFSGPIDPQDFAGGTWAIDAALITTVTRNYGDIPASPLGDLLEDSFLTNSSTSGGYFELVLDGLTPGDYQLTTYHHSFDFGGATAGAFGALEGDVLSFLNDVTSTTGTDISSVATLSVDFTTTALQDGYVLRFDPTNAAGSFHFDLSGFEIEGTVIPEPSTFSLVGLGLVALFRHARHRRSPES